MGYNKNHKRTPLESIKHFFSKKWVIGFLVVILVFGIGLGGWYIYQNHFNKDEIDLTKSEVFALSYQEVYQKANTMIISGDINGAINYYDEVISKTSDNSNKASYIIAKATVIYNYLDDTYNSRAIEVMKEAEAIYSSTSITSFIAQMYDESGDADNAIIYYQKTIDIINNDHTKSDDEKKSASRYYQSKIDSLKETMS